MKFTKDSIARLTLPEGKSEHFEWDSELPGFGVRLRGKSKRWVVQYRFGGRQRREMLGDFRKVTLDDARKIARNRFAQVELGTDPGAARAAERAAAAAATLTLGLVADRYMQARPRRSGTRRPGTMRLLRRHFEALWLPLRAMPIGDIKRADVAAQLQQIARENGPPTAGLARASLSALYGWAMREGMVEANPVVATNNPGAGTKPRERVLSDAELRLIWHACEDDDFGRIIKLLILTGCRRDEIGRLTWPEVDAGVLTLPGERTKNGRALTLPLSPMAVALLPPPRYGRPYVFGERGRGFNSWGYGRIRLDTRIAKPLPHWTLHDLRRTMRTGLGKIGVPPHIAELTINHVKGGIQAVYDKHHYGPEIRDALARWASHVASIVASEP